jgi:hypothetical protein
MAVDRMVEIASAAADLQVCLIDVPGAPPGSALAAAALPELLGQGRGELGLPLAHGLVAYVDIG